MLDIRNSWRQKTSQKFEYVLRVYQVSKLKQLHLLMHGAQ